MKNGVRFEYVPWMSDFVSIQMFEFILVKKLANFDFETH